MLTLKELKKIVKVADVEKRIPSVKSLKEHKVVVKEMMEAEMDDHLGYEKSERSDNDDYRKRSRTHPFFLNGSP